LWAYIGFYDALGPNFFQLYRPLMAGTVAGLFVGDVKMGMLMGGTLELMALGVYTYGGATIPDYQSGAILGTYFAVQTNSFETGLALAIPAALLLTQVDILNRFLTSSSSIGLIPLQKKAMPRGLSERWSCSATLFGGFRVACRFSWRLLSENPWLMRYWAFSIRLPGSTMASGQ
jgi:mannose/fructose/N-acetylgalactosamine-specific phosphotransferase system component IIC